MLHWPMFCATCKAKASHEKLHSVTVSHSTRLSHADEAYKAETETAVHGHTFRVIRLCVSEKATELLFASAHSALHLVIQSDATLSRK